MAPAGGAGAWHAAGVQAPSAIGAISCPTASLCVAVDQGGDVITSTDPAAATGWHVASVASGHALTAVSCSWSRFCAVADTNGNVITSTNPTAGAAAWTTTHVDNVALGAIACRLGCVALDQGGGVVTAASSAAGVWSGVSPVDPAVALGSLSCATDNFCVAGDALGNLLFSTNPAGGRSAWSVSAGSGSAIGGVSCPTVSFCAAVDAGGSVSVYSRPVPSALAALAPPTVSGGVARIRLACRGASDACSGRITLSILRGGAGRPLIVRSKPFTVALGVSRTVHIRLGVPGGRLLIARGRLAGVLSVRQGGRRVAGRIVVFAVARRH